VKGDPFFLVCNTKKEIEINSNSLNLTVEVCILWAVFCIFVYVITRHQVFGTIDHSVLSTLKSQPFSNNVILKYNGGIFVPHVAIVH
jgi:hypothetical protein